MVNMADLSSEVRQVHKDSGSGLRRKTGEAFTVDFGDMKSKEGKKNLQESFLKFRKQRQKEIRDEKRLKERRLRQQGDQEYMNKLRKKFIKRAKKYYGTPYARKYWTPDKPEYKSRLFLDCCGLVRQVMRDLRKDFGFRLGPWNQAYMYDTLPITIEREEDMKPGDLVFISGVYPRPNARQQKHFMTHVEIWAGDGCKTIGARWNNGKVQLWDHYKFEAKSFQNAQYHFKSLDTWLQGICRSFCSEHKWRRSFSPNKKSIFSVDTDKQRAQPGSSSQQNDKQLPQVKNDSTASPEEEDQEGEGCEDEDEDDIEEEEEGADEPAFDSDEEGASVSSGDPEGVGSVNAHKSHKFYKCTAARGINNSPLEDSDEDSDYEDLSIDGKLANLNVNETSVSKFGRLQRSHTDMVPGTSRLEYCDTQRQQSNSVQELPSRFPVIINDVAKTKYLNKSRYDRIKNLSERCLAPSKNSLIQKQESGFKTRKKSLHERRQIFQGLEQSESLLLIDNDDNVEFDESEDRQDDDYVHVPDKNENNDQSETIDDKCSSNTNSTDEQHVEDNKNGSECVEGNEKCKEQINKGDNIDQTLEHYEDDEDENIGESSLSQGDLDIVAFN